MGTSTRDPQEDPLAYAARLREAARKLCAETRELRAASLELCARVELQHGETQQRAEVSDPPEYEIDTLLITVADATDLANDGQVQDGMQCLIAGRGRAEDAAEIGEPWGRVLVACYQSAMTRFVERYGQLD